MAHCVLVGVVCGSQRALEVSLAGSSLAVLRLRGMSGLILACVAVLSLMGMSGLVLPAVPILVLLLSLSGPAASPCVSGHVAVMCSLMRDDQSDGS